MKAIERIIGAIPAEAKFTDADRDEARILLMACVLWALPYEGPDRSGIEQLRRLKNGYGCWLDYLRSGINLADLSANERGFFLGGFGMAKALLFSFMVAAQEAGGRPASPRQSKKRNGRNASQQVKRQSVRHASEAAVS
ncbi:hypothetical protein [Methylobacterium fujisawaense]|uniref:hypothetical protein n=1 Tax=Methylobacterium TaxID=407 RepID=UPI0036FB5AE8